MSAILFHESLFFMNLYSALLSLPFSVYFFAILLYFSFSWLFSTLFCLYLSFLLLPSQLFITVIFFPSH